MRWGGYELQHCARAGGCESAMSALDGFESLTPGDCALRALCFDRAEG